MKVILTKDIEGYGFLGDIVEVKRGFANNYLIPRGYALPATDNNVKHVQEILKQKRKKLEREKRKAEELAKKLEGVIVEITKPIGEGGKLFGSVTASEIVKALKEKGIEIDRKNLILNRPIREIGLFTLLVRLHREVTTQIKVEIKPAKT